MFLRRASSISRLGSGWAHQVRSTFAGDVRGPKTAGDWLKSETLGAKDSFDGQHRIHRAAPIAAFTASVIFASMAWSSAFAISGCAISMRASSP